MPCYRCGVRQTDPERGSSPWRRGVRQDALVLVCPACQEAGDWTADLEHCARCDSAHLIRRLGQVECLDCGLVREPVGTLAPSAGQGGAGQGGASQGSAGQGSAGRGGPDPALADEVGRALDRILGRR